MPVARPLLPLWRKVVARIEEADGSGCTPVGWPAIRLREMTHAYAPALACVRVCVSASTPCPRRHAVAPLGKTRAQVKRPHTGVKAGEQETPAADGNGNCKQAPEGREMVHGRRALCRCYSRVVEFIDPLSRHLLAPHTHTHHMPPRAPWSPSSSSASPAQCTAELRTPSLPPSRAPSLTHPSLTHSIGSRTTQTPHTTTRARLHHLHSEDHVWPQERRVANRVVGDGEGAEAR